MRQSEGERINPKGEARAHQFVGGVPKTVAESVYSGEQNPLPRSTTERGKRGGMREESRAKGMGGVVMAREAVMGEKMAALPRGFTAPLMPR